MLKVWALCVVAVVVLMLPSDGDAECCLSRAKNANIGATTSGVNAGWSPVCGDCTLPTPCCATGKCNIFCCNCDGRCREGCIVRRFADLIPGVVSTEEMTSTAHDVIRAADIDEDGRLSLEEAYTHLGGYKGESTHRMKRSLMDMDLDNNGFLSAREIDPIGTYH